MKSMQSTGKRSFRPVVRGQQASQPTERENKELKQKQDDEILQEINGEEKVEYGLTNDYMFRSVFQTSEEALRGLLGVLLYIPEEERQKMKNIAKSH